MLQRSTTLPRRVPPPLPAQPFVVSIADIEHVHFERVLFSAKNFDLVIIFKVKCIRYDWCLTCASQASMCVCSSAV